MSRFIGAPAVWKLLRTGDLHARLRATRDGIAGIRLHVAGAALATGVLDALAAGSASTADLARATGATDERLLATFLRVVASAGLIRSGGDEASWRLTARGRAVIRVPRQGSACRADRAVAVIVACRRAERVRRWRSCRHAVE